MRFHSTAESIANREITVLAVIECAIAFALYFLVSKITGSLLNFEFAIVFAPLFLLRTEYSAQLALNLLDKFLDIFDNINSEYLGIMYLLFLPAIALMIRFTATAFGFITRPISTIRSISDNWIRQSFCTDLFFPPELIPGESSDDKFLNFNVILDGIKSALAGQEGTTSKNILLLIFILTISILGFLPAILMRITFKSTFFCYMPLAFLARSTVGVTASTKLRLEELLNGKMEGARKALALFIGTLALLKCLFAYDLINKSVISDSLKSDKIADSFISSGHWPAWQLLSLTDALLTLGIMIVADLALRRLNMNELKSPALVESTLSTLTFVRGVTAIAAVAFAFSGAIAGLLQSSGLTL